MNIIGVMKVSIYLINIESVADSEREEVVDITNHPP